MGPRIVVLVGLPGSGKTTYARAKRLPVLSSDDVRVLLFDDVTNQSNNRRVFAVLRYLLKQRLELGRWMTCVDATNLTPGERRAYIGMGLLYGCEVEAVYFDVPLAVCKDRNRGRDRVVPDEVMERMAGRMVAPSTEEGFARVTVIRAEDAAEKEKGHPEMPLRRVDPFLP